MNLSPMSSGANERMIQRRERTSVQTSVQTSERLSTLRVDFIVSLPTVGWTDGRMDRPSYRDARTHLKSVTKFRINILLV